jgi:phosphopantetheinyl transferase (holo-ACP synthase)
MLSRSQNRIKMMARVFAETGFKNLILAIHELLMKHGSPFPVRRQDSFKMINPREWTRRERMVVKVGTGYANRMEKISNAEAVLAKQQLVVQAGGMGRLLTEQNVFNALADWCKASGVPVSKYFADPETMPAPPPPQPDAQTMAVQVANKEAEVKAMQTAANVKLDWQKHMDDVQIQREQIASNHYLKAKELELKYGSQVDEAPDGTAAHEQAESSAVETSEHATGMEPADEARAA